ncbi:ABC transporter ATP-binding protein [Curtobacterium sp. NPDC089689]|uniref:ABC transporter ATP-binding protein n=1 Tax=Curtobacterium sp. NPDC089689 TaxID=3363968 RepID=UPI00382879EB
MRTRRSGDRIRVARTPPDHRNHQGGTLMSHPDRSPAVRVRNVTARRAGRVLWSGLDHDAQAGTMTAIVGPSGCGKSTLLQCVGQLGVVDDGQIDVLGTPTASAPPRVRRRLRRDVIGYLFQDGGLVEDTTLLDNLELVSPDRRSRRVRASRIPRALDAVGLGGRERDLVHTLSGGERQRVAIARVLVKRPLVVLADEPTASLDPVNEQCVLDLLRELADEGATVLLATHSGAAAGACDRVLDLGAAS